MGYHVPVWTKVPGLWLKFIWFSRVSQNASLSSPSLEMLNNFNKFNNSCNFKDLHHASLMGAKLNEDEQTKLLTYAFTSKWEYEAFNKSLYELAPFSICWKDGKKVE